MSEHLILIDKQSTLGATDLSGFSVLINSDATFNGPLTNDGSLVEIDSNMTVPTTINGTGTITDINSTTTAGGVATSETVNLLDNSQLWLGGPTFLAPIGIDATSSIHLYGADNIASVASNLSANGAPEEMLPFHGLFSVHSLTPGYVPTAEFTFSQPGPEITGVYIFDKPIVAHS
jgi:hypothetical protein